MSTVPGFYAISLPSGSCKGNALFIDASVAGISGDMFVGVF